MKRKRFISSLFTLVLISASVITVGFIANEDPEDGICVIKADFLIMEVGKNFHYKELRQLKVVDLLITIDPVTEIVAIDNKNNDKFYVRDEETRPRQKDDDGWFTILDMKCFDNKNNEVLLTCKMWDDGIAQLYILYSNFRCVYQGKVIS